MSSSKLILVMAVQLLVLPTFIGTFCSLSLVNVTVTRANIVH